MKEKVRNTALVLAMMLLTQMLLTIPLAAMDNTAALSPEVVDLAPSAIEPLPATIGLTPAAIGLTPAAIDLTPAAIGLTPSAIGLTPAAVALPSLPKDDESLWYRSQNPMKKDHQKILWENSKRNGLDYIDMLALVATESNFDEKCIAAKRYYGYFQIGKGHFANLAHSLTTENAPLDGAVNIRWGTAMVGWIMADKRVTSLEPEKRRDAALSIYQRGPAGYDRYGVNEKYLVRFYKKRAMVEKWFASEETVP